MITTFYPPFGFGGDANYVQLLAQQLVGRGHSVDVIHCRDSYRMLGGRTSLEDTPREPNIAVHGLESGWGALSPLATHQTGSPFFKRRQIEQVLSQSFDVIHYHNISLVGGPKVLLSGRGVKLYTWHEYWLLCPTSLLMRNGREPCLERRCTSCTLKQGRPPQWWRSTRLMKESLRSVDAFLSPSRFALTMHSELQLEAPQFHLPNFVPAADPAPRTEQRDPYFLFVGRLEYGKGAHTIIEPFRKWNRARLVIAGAGSQARNLREESRGSDRIEFTGHVSMDELRTLYRNTVAVILPSLNYEVFPLAILEAFREATPVIARNIGSLPETIQESGGGFLYNNDEELIEHAERFLTDAPLRDRIGALGQQAMRTKWSAEVHLERYLNIIAELREKSSEGRGLA
jgi:glycosyltransferase involved in cell wall biosynthesis